MNIKNDRFTLDLSDTGLSDIARVGGKNASLGELRQHLTPLGINVPDGFATTSEAYRRFLEEDDLKARLQDILGGLDPNNTRDLQRRGKEARSAVMRTPFPKDLIAALTLAHSKLRERIGPDHSLAVRSSATAEDLPEASFAGAAETFLNVNGEEELLSAIHHCYASLFTDRAINYRRQMGFDDLAVALSVGVQSMVRSDLASSGVIFTLDTESGFRDVVQISGAFGLGESVVKGSVTPDEWLVFKPTLANASAPIIGRKLGSKKTRLVYSSGRRATRVQRVSLAERLRFSLTDDEVVTLAKWACRIEEHYSNIAGRPQPMDIEWAKDGASGELFIVQARPETVHSTRERTTLIATYRLKAPPVQQPLTTGEAVGQQISTGRVRIVKSTSELSRVRDGDVLVARNTNPDWEPVMRRVTAIVTDQGGRTAHAAIVSRELGLTCVVGCGNATRVLKDGAEVTVVCSEGPEGRVYPGKLDFAVEQQDIGDVPKTKTQIMLNIADPAQAFKLSTLPVDGVGLARIEFIIANTIGIHPLAAADHATSSDSKLKRRIDKLCEADGFRDPREFFITKLAEGIGRIGAAFYPRPVIVRMSDFKTNEYARLIGGEKYEPREENPMLGFRGASRYYDERYRRGFALECAAAKRVREEMGLTNVRLMIPFCRTVEEAIKVVYEMMVNGLRQGEKGLEIYAMCELPSNVVSADRFLDVFDGYSIGSNDLTQLILGIDRDAGTIAGLFDEENEAVKDMIAAAIRSASRSGKPIGICGQAPSDRPGFAAWLVQQGITSISLNADSVVETRRKVAEIEQSMPAAKTAHR